MLTRPIVASYNTPPWQQIVVRLEAPWYTANLAQPKQTARIVLLRQAHSLARRMCKAMQTHKKQANQLMIYKKNTNIIMLHIGI